MNTRRQLHTLATPHRAGLVCGTLLLFIAATLFLPACGSPEPQTITIGIINAVPVLDTVLEGFKEGMAELGYVEGETIAYSYGGPVGQDQLDSVATGLVEAGVDLILSITSPATQAAKRATTGTDIPVVFAVVLNPVQAGIVQSAAHPGENITGVKSSQGEDVKLEWLTRIAPGVERVYLPYNPEDNAAAMTLDQVEQIAPKLDIQLVPSQTSNPAQVVAAIDSIPDDVDAIFLVTDSLNAAYRDNWARAALSRQLPLVVPPGGDPSETGSLFTYGFSLASVGKQTARIADQILKGAAPANLPVEGPELYLSINLKTAKAIGLTIPDEILRQASTVIR